MLKQNILIIFAALLLGASVGCTQQNSDAAPVTPQSTKTAAVQPGPSDTKAVWTKSLKAKNGVGLDRLDQTTMQAACSNAADAAGSTEAANKIRSAATASIKYPADGNYLGDWPAGEQIAQNGKGMQYSDDPSTPNGGNCYACHQLDPGATAFGTLGPSLKNYGARGQGEAVLKYTWAKLWNSHATNACSHMPRFGDAGILTTEQLRDVMALLLAPDSPVNQSAQSQ